MWREVAQWLKPLLLTRPRMAEIGAVSKKKNWAPHRLLQVLPDCAPLSCGLFTPRCLHPPPLADNHRAGFSFLHSFSFFSHYGFSQEGAFTTQVVWPPKK